ncbi:RNA polymerase subunit sigma-70 [Nocardia sp. BSTN01]|uniref:RNA polymerase subunit sigma-70 n=1 Tax=Nocardia sp. BSTN01 TaxID=2783665 RepID=UPI001890A6A1|nr:RNA polymerase subunit sigma-70 [Nocardia sp. BSTN01]MBF5000385.1 RNA polymerase subunit sigma-70 [Nocardia sp. BSTN01]
MQTQTETADIPVEPVSTEPTEPAHWEELHARYRQELLGYCYRMLGSPFDADDAVQETMLRAWRGLDQFAGRSSRRAWMYRIATNVCLDMLRRRGRAREHPLDSVESGTASSALGDRLSDDTWVQPAPDTWLFPTKGDPAETVVLRDSVRLAFVVALQHLLPRQRAALILCDVLRWPADEAAALLGLTVASTNGMLRRARQRLAGLTYADGDPYLLTDEQRRLLARYVDAFERTDLDTLTSLLTEDATLSMPPYPLWLSGRAQIDQWFRRTPNPCVRARTALVNANGSPALAVYHATAPGQPYKAFGIQLLTFRDTQIAAIDIYLDPALFPKFDLPTQLSD